LLAIKKRGVYKINIDAYIRIESCLVINYSFLWHKRLIVYIGKDILFKLVKNKLVKELPDIELKKKKLCNAFQMGK